jgi:hypothetical protein
MQKLGPGGIALVPVAEARRPAAGQVSSATVGRLAAPARLATPEKMARVSVTKDTL